MKTCETCAASFIGPMACQTCEVNMKILYIIRGHSGSGKSTLAENLTVYNYCADEFMVDENGKYKFEPLRLQECHELCMSGAEDAMRYGQTQVAVHNTFTRKWEYEPYLKLAAKYGYSVSEIVCRGNFKNTHGVPYEIVEKQKQRFEF